MQVACTQPLAAEAGLRILKAGGNAADAAIAVAAAMQVTEPCSTGLGGDAFALYYNASTKTVEGLNGSGRSASLLTVELAKEQFGIDAVKLPDRHGMTVTVPGAAAAWCDTVEKWGSMPLSDILQPAIELAVKGFPVSPITAHSWQHSAGVLTGHPHSDTTLLVDGVRGPRPGEVFFNPDLSRVLYNLGKLGKASFYEGATAAAICEAVKLAGGVLSEEDLSAHTTEFVTPISTNYRGIDVWEIPPNGQGLTALLALNILSHLPTTFLDASTTAVPAPIHCSAIKATLHSSARPSRPGEAQWLHVCIEALRLAFTDTRWYIADSEHSSVPVKELLSVEYARERASLLSPACAVVDPVIGRPTSCSDTVSFQVVDGWGNACSFINSNYMGFGTGIVPHGCGFSLQNRGANFSLVHGHPNVLAPSKRPYHTIIPGMATYADTNELCCSFSVMGGFMQPQGHVQVISNMIDFGLDPQTALDLPRFCITDGSADSAIAFEDGVPDEVRAQLKRMGHKMYSALPVKGYARSLFGRGQIILRDRESGVLWGASDGRGDGCALGW